MKLLKNTKVLKPILKNTSTRANGTPLEGDIIVIAIDNHMVVIHV
jgi:hypothetical protein